MINLIALDRAIKGDSEFETELKAFYVKKCIEAKYVKYRDWANRMPELEFDADWKVKIIPPFGGALVRFIVSKNDKHVSVYFDAYSQLSWMEEDGKHIPYWECYPASNGDIERFLLGEEKELLQEIRNVLNE